jgi:regulator of sirC expression with transglutaminase-like and TPR domain
LAQDEFPSLDIQQVLSDMDHWAARLKRSILPGADALDKLRELNHFFYANLRFAGNVNHYDNPHNSYLNVVMSTRLGIPISLAVLWLELGQKHWPACVWRGFPRTFFGETGFACSQEGHVVIDPFSGESLSREDLCERLVPWLPGTSFGQLNAISDDVLAFHLQAAEPARSLRVCCAICTKSIAAKAITTVC